MDSNLYVSAAVVAAIFLLAKFIDFRFISKPSAEDGAEGSSHPMKTALRDAALVFICYILGYYIVKQFYDTPAILGNTKPEIFTGDAGF
jgi:hypothetical protein